MACGKGNANQPIEDFIVHSPAPVDVAAKMSAIYNELSFKVGNQFYDKILRFFIFNQSEYFDYTIERTPLSLSFFFWSSFYIYIEL